MFLLDLGLNNFFKELYASNKLASSGKWRTLLNFMLRVKSLMYIEKSSTPRTQPCETPNSLRALSDV